MKLLLGSRQAVFALWFLVACQGSVMEGKAKNDDPGSGGVRGGSGGTAAKPIVELPSQCLEQPSVGRGQMRRLTRAQYSQTVKDLLGLDADTSGFLPDTATGPFLTNAKFSAQDADVENYAVVAEALAKRAVASVDSLTRCGSLAEGECAERFIKDMGKRAYRRPLSEDEVQSLRAAYEAGREDSFAFGIQLVIESLLQSPSFLYLPEFGGNPENSVAKLTGYEVASRLSYLFTNSMPNAELFEAAEQGVLDTPDGVREQAIKLMNDASFMARAASSFHEQLLHINALGEDGAVTKESTLYPEFNQELRHAMQDETNKFVEHVFVEGDSSLETLLTAPYSFPSGALLKVYGLAASDLSEAGRYDFPEGTRAGLLTQASVMAVEPALPSRFSVVYRGNMVRTKLLCQEMPAPAEGDADFTPPEGADEMTAQELLRAHQKNPSCAGCHTLMDNIGFGFENYDAVGRYKTRAADGSEIDNSGNVLNSDVEGEFRGPVELAQRLAQSRDVRFCFAKQWFRYALGRDPQVDEKTPRDDCSLGAVANALAEGKGDVRQALLILVTSDAFRYRQGEGQ